MTGAADRWCASDGEEDPWPPVTSKFGCAALHDRPSKVAAGGITCWLLCGR